MWRRHFRDEPETAAPLYYMDSRDQCSARDDDNGDDGGDDGDDDRQVFSFFVSVSCVLKLFSFYFRYRNISN